MSKKTKLMNTPQTTIEGDFPYEEIRRPDGDYFQSWQEAKDAGWDDDQIWSVTSAEGDDGSEWIITGPPHHYVNHIGHVATLERHDNNTYYEECWRTEDEEEDEPVEPPCPHCGREEDGKWFTPCPSDDCPSHEQPPKTDPLELENISLRVMLATALDALVEHGDETTEPWLREQLLKLK